MNHAHHCMKVFFQDDGKPCTCGALRPKIAREEYEYIAGGWFRQVGVPSGIHAAVLHGDQVIAHYYRRST